MPAIPNSRRSFLRSSAAVGAALVLPQSVRSALSTLQHPVRLGIITDLHQDIMHDAPQRLDVFLRAMQQEQPNALLQLGDFAYPTKQNEVVQKAFEDAHERTLHVLGNHEIDDGHSFDKVAELWGMQGRYYTEQIDGLHLIVLDANEKPAHHRGGYPAHIGAQQLAWLETQLREITGPIVVVSHQPLAGPSCIDNAAEVQALLNAAADKVLLAVNGHTHIDHVATTGMVPCLHVNSASYQWVGGDYRNTSYPAQIHAGHRWIEYTCPYRDSLFAVLTVDPDSGQVNVQGRSSEWAGKSPQELGVLERTDWKHGVQVCPQIRSRQISGSVGQ